jgi:type II secretory pathway component PulJ
MSPASLLSPRFAGSPLHAHRRGRLLVEVLIAMVLLAIAATASASLIRTNLVLTDRIAFLATSRAVTRSVAAELHSAACAATAGESQRGRTEIVWSPSVSGPFVTLAVAAHGAPHPSGLPAPRSLSAELAGWCP